MVNDHLSDLVSRIKNAYGAGKTVVEAPMTKMNLAVCKVLEAEGYLGKIEQKEKGLQAALVYKGGTPGIKGIKRVSRPGTRIYRGYTNLPRVWGGLGMSILSTPSGVVSAKQARKLKVGGEVLFLVW